MAIWFTPFACGIPKVTDAHGEYLILVAVRCNNGYTYVSECYVLRTWPVLLIVYKSELRDFFVVFRQKLR